MSATLITCVAVQSTWLLPELNERVQTVIDGAPLRDSPVHAAYAALEGLKFLALVLLAVRPFEHADSEESPLLD